MASKPRCSKCSRDHWHFTPCDQVPPPPNIEWKEDMHEWGDRVQGSPGGPVQDGGWGCRTILPPERK